MIVTLNGKPREIEGPVTIADLLCSLDITPRQVAVALNGDVLPRDRWPEVAIGDGDTVEVVRAVGGGSLAASTHWGEYNARGSASCVSSLPSLSSSRSWPLVAGGTRSPQLRSHPSRRPQ